MKTRINGVDVWVKKCKNIFSDLAVEIVICIVLAITYAFLMGSIIK